VLLQYISWSEGVIFTSLRVTVIGPPSTLCVRVSSLLVSASVPNKPVR